MAYGKVRGLGLKANGPFWSDYIHQIFLPYVREFENAVFDRVLLTFGAISEEADRKSEEAWDRLISQAHPDADPGDLAEAATEAGIEYYQLVSGIRQTVLNMTTVALHHLVEQQQVVLLRRELLPKTEETREIRRVRQEFVSQLQAQDVDPESYDSWEQLRDLQYAANAIKHGDGESARVLRARRPSLFVYPLFRGDERSEKLSRLGRIETPLAGEGIYVAEQDLRGFFEAVVAFWERIAEDFAGAAGL